MKKAAMLKILLLQGANLTFLGRRGRGVGFASATNAGKDWHSAPPSTAGTICTKLEALDDRHPKPDRVWNRIPDDVRERIIRLALDEPALSARELAARFTDTEGYFVSEASVYRLLKARDLIASPAFIVMKAADEFSDKTTAPNQLWQTDFTYLKVIGWGWFYLSTVLDDFSRYIIVHSRSSKTESIRTKPLECREYSYEPDMCGVIRYFTTTSEHPARSRSA
jgi:integrase-like protein/homeodomain-containing protein